MLKTKLIAKLALSLLLVGAGGQALAASNNDTSSTNNDTSLLDVLKDNGTITADQYQQIKVSEKAERTTRNPRNVFTSKHHPNVDNLYALSENGAFKARSADGNFEFQIGGAMMVDSAYMFNSGVPTAPNSANYGSGIDFRTARVDLIGRVYDDWVFRLLYDFMGEDQGSGIDDAFIGYSGFDFGGKAPTLIKFGSFAEAFGMELRESIYYTPFIERQIDSYALGFGKRSMGIISSSTIGKNWFGISVTGKPVGEYNPNEHSGGVSAASRFVMNPVLNIRQQHLLHFGVSARFHDYKAEDSFGNLDDGIYAAPIGTADVAPISLKRAIVIDRLGGVADYQPNHSYGLNAEFGVISGPFQLRAETYHRDIAVTDSLTAMDDHLRFDGYHTTLSWTFGGINTYVHKPAYSNWGPIIVKHPLHAGGHGALQLVAGTAYVDLNDGNVHGGRMQDYTIGAKWIPERSIRIELNYMHSSRIDGGFYDGMRYNKVIARAQIQF